MDVLERQGLEAMAIERSDRRKEALQKIILVSTLPCANEPLLLFGMNI